MGAYTGLSESSVGLFRLVGDVVSEIVVVDMYNGPTLPVFT